MPRIVGYPGVRQRAAVSDLGHLAVLERGSWVTTEATIPGAAIIW